MKLPPGRRGVGREPKDKSEGREIDTEVIEVVRGEGGESMRCRPNRTLSPVYRPSSVPETFARSCMAVI